MGVLNAKIGTEWVPISAGQYNIDHWNSAWGIVANGSLVTPSPMSIPIVVTQITNSLSFTTTVGRRYRVVVAARAMRTVTATQAYAAVALRDGVTGLFAQPPILMLPAQSSGMFVPLYYEWILTGDGVLRSYNVSANTPSQNSEVYTDYAGCFYIEDIGPVTYLATGATPPASDWTAYDARYVTVPTSWVPLTLTSSYVTEGSGFTVPAVRKIGDTVYVRGSATLTGTWTAVSVATLPTGFRPPAHLRIMMGAHKANVGVAALIRGSIDTNGTINLSEYSATDKANPVVYLGDISPFSVV